jgi:predicted metal-binding protein
MEDILEEIFNKNNCPDFRPIDPAQIRVNQWVRFKCMWGCRNYGIRANCPPNVPPIEETQKFLSEFSQAVIFHFRGACETREERYAWTGEINTKLLALEREVFLLGHYKAFAMFVDACHFCEECSGSRATCQEKMNSRPAPDALGIDVYKAARDAGYHIEVLTDPAQEMDRYGFLFID